jgi:L-asparaginase
LSKDKGINVIPSNYFTNVRRILHKVFKTNTFVINQFSMAIRIFITGGTFDKEYNEKDGTLFFQDSHLPEMLHLGRNKVPVDIRTLMMIDSLQMTEDDREIIARNCIGCEEDRIIITHGTDTMVETATLLAAKKINKTIVITGAMIPYKFGSSDGLFNLGSALAFVQTLPKGVYVAMNGRWFNWDNVRKNKQTAEFEEKNPPL